MTLSELTGTDLLIVPLHEEAHHGRVVLDATVEDRTS